MSERRPLVEGLKAAPAANKVIEEQFVYGEAAKPAAGRPAVTISRVPFTTRMRADLADALKSASLKRQLDKIEPNTVQDILESALEPWLKANGYLR